MVIVFLGTGASGGTPGVGKSQRLESSILIKDSLNILIDVTRDFLKQVKYFSTIDSVLLTHGHQDACGGIDKLQNWLKKQKRKVKVLAHPKTILTIQKKFKLLPNLELVPVKDGQEKKIGSWVVIPYKVPHAQDSLFPTFAWKLKGEKTIVYASDIAQLTKEFKKICQNIDILIVDGATWKRKIYSHLRVDQDLREICQWKVGQIIITHIGKSAPYHEHFAKEIAKICPQAFPAYDGLAISFNQSG